MSRINLFILGVLLGLSCTSNAVNLNNDGTGQVLIYPYYTVQNGNQTLISVLNSSTLGKAVKLRVFESFNSREVLSLNLYLAPEDVWTGAVFAPTATGSGALISVDGSCTAPQLSDSEERINGLPFRSFTNVNYVGANADGAATTSDRSREGHIEILEMASILPGSPLAALIGQETGIRRCELLAQEWTNNPGGAGPYFSSLAPAAGGLSGMAAIVDSMQGTYINYSPEILDGFYRIIEHTRPDSTSPSLRSAWPESIVLHEGKAIRSSWNKPEDAVSALFVAEQLRNEFTIEVALNAASDWVLSFPTKRYYTDPALGGLSTLNVIPAPPFTRAFANGRACEIAEHFIHDRNGNRINVPGHISGFPPLPPISYCYGVSTTTILQQASRVLSSSSSNYIYASLLRPASGWVEINFSTVHSDGNSTLRRMRPSLEGHEFVGLPVIGFSAIRLENSSAAPGVRGYYGGASNHKRKIRCARTNSEGQNSACF